jgi:hypothetical protein
MVMAIDMQTYKSGMQKKNQKSSCSFNAFLIVVSMNPSPSFLQYNTNMVMATTKQTNKQTTNRIKTRGKERGARRAPTLLTITDLHILLLFLQQHEGDGDGKTSG